LIGLVVCRTGNPAANSGAEGRNNLAADEILAVVKHGCISYRGI
jgi:hypothetical protein